MPGRWAGRDHVAGEGAVVIRPHPPGDPNPPRTIPSSFPDEPLNVGDIDACRRPSPERADGHLDEPLDPLARVRDECPRALVLGDHVHERRSRSRVKAASTHFASFGSSGSSVTWGRAGPAVSPRHGPLRGWSSNHLLEAERGDSCSDAGFGGLGLMRSRSSRASSDVRRLRSPGRVSVPCVSPWCASCFCLP